MSRHDRIMANYHRAMARAGLTPRQRAEANRRKGSAGLEPAPFRSRTGASIVQGRPSQRTAGGAR